MPAKHAQTAKLKEESSSLTSVPQEKYGNNISSNFMK